MDKTSSLALVIAIALSTTAYAKATNSMTVCEKLADEWKSAYNKQDASALTALYDRNGEYSSGFWTGSGRDALTQGFQKEWSTGGTMANITCEQSNRIGNLNYATGTYSAGGKSPDGKDVTMGGHWLTVSEIRNGKYFILKHNGNMQMPAPPK